MSFIIIIIILRLWFVVKKEWAPGLFFIIRIIIFINIIIDIIFINVLYYQYYYFEYIFI